MKKWSGKVPVRDDFGYPIVGTFIDGRTRMGPWAIMSLSTFNEHGVGLGLGKGQKYRLNLDTNDWELVVD